MLTARVRLITDWYALAIETDHQTAMGNWILGDPDPDDPHGKNGNLRIDIYNPTAEQIKDMIKALGKGYKAIKEGP